jgi:hypothetical protein
MLYAIIDAQHVYAVVPEIRGLLSWVQNLPRDLSRRVPPK